MSEEDKLKTNNEKVTINDYYYYYLLKCENTLNELEKWCNNGIKQELNYEDVLDKIKALKENNK